MLDHIIVEIDGVKMPLNHLAVVSVMDSKTLSVNPYDPNVMNLYLLSLLLVVSILAFSSSLACVTVINMCL